MFGAFLQADTTCLLPQWLFSSPLSGATCFHLSLQPFVDAVAHDILSIGALCLEWAFGIVVETLCGMPTSLLRVLVSMPSPASALSFLLMCTTGGNRNGWNTCISTMWKMWIEFLAPVS